MQGREIPLFWGDFSALLFSIETVTARTMSSEQRGQNSMTNTWPDWLTRRELSTYLKETHGIRLGVSSLAAMAGRGDGPPFAREGRLVSYPRADADAWAQKRRSPLVRSTRELKRIRVEAVDMEAA
jgi:hypothetical protein